MKKLLTLVPRTGRALLVFSGRRAARARRDEGAYREYATEEQRSHRRAESAKPGTIFRFVGLLLFGVIAAGCFGGGKTPTMQYYWIPLWQQVQPTSGEPIPVVIQVEGLDVDPGYDHLRIVYRISSVQLRHYKFRQWVTKPGRLLTAAVQRYLRVKRQFRLVTRAPQPLPNYILRGRIMAIEQVEEGSKRELWSARVAMHLRLHRSSDNKVVWRMRFDRKQRVKKRTPQDIVSLITRLIRVELDRELPSLTGAVRQDLARK